MFLFKKKPVEKAEDFIEEDATYGDSEEEVLKNIRDKLRSPNSKVVPYQSSVESANSQEEPEQNNVDDDVIEDEDYQEEENEELESDEEQDTSSNDDSEESENNEEDLEEEDEYVSEEANTDDSDDEDDDETDEEEDEYVSTNNESDEIDDIIVNNAKLGMENSNNEYLKDYEHESNGYEYEKDSMNSPSSNVLDSGLISNSVKEQTKNYISELLTASKSAQRQERSYENVQDISLVTLVAPVIKDYVKNWMDNNLASLVNDIVKTEIKKLLDQK